MDDFGLLDDDFNLSDDELLNEELVRSPHFLKTFPSEESAQKQHKRFRFVRTPQLETKKYGGTFRNKQDQKKSSNGTNTEQRILIKSNVIDTKNGNNCNVPNESNSSEEISQNNNIKTKVFVNSDESRSREDENIFQSLLEDDVADDDFLSQIDFEEEAKSSGPREDNRLENKITSIYSDNNKEKTEKPEHIEGNTNLKKVKHIKKSHYPSKTKTTKMDSPGYNNRTVSREIIPKEICLLPKPVTTVRAQRKQEDSTIIGATRKTNLVQSKNKLPTPMSAMANTNQVIRTSTLIKHTKDENTKIFLPTKINIPKLIVPISHVTPKRTLPNTDTSKCKEQMKNSNKSRRFPGPAGNLPKMTSPDFHGFESIRSPETTSKTLKRPLTPRIPITPLYITPSQEIDDISTDLWKEMKNFVQDSFDVLEVDNIKTTLQKAAFQKLNNSKASVLYGLIRSFSVHGTAGKLILKDNSAEIDCTVHRNVLEEHHSILKAGTGIVLKDVSVYSPSTKKHYVNITPANIVRYFLADSSVGEESFTQTPRPDNLRTSSGCPTKEKRTSRDIENFFSDSL